MFDSGITTLNLAVSGKPDEFASPGNTVSYVGESDAGKTIAALTLAAASFYQNKGKVRCIYYAFEPNLMIDTSRLFGAKFSKALEIVSEQMSIEKWQDDIRSRYKKAKLPLIVITDSTDALRAQVDIDALDAGKDTIKAGYGTARAAAFSLCMPEIAKAVKANKGLHVMISQLRENPAQLFGSNKRRSGGKALDYYSEQQIWFLSSTKTTVDKVKVGGWTKIDVRRNKVTGETRTVYAPIFPAYGVDDVRSMLHFLAETESGAEWVGRDLEKIKVGEETMTLARMAEFYDQPDTKPLLIEKVVTAWNERENSIRNEVIGTRKGRWS